MKTVDPFKFTDLPTRKLMEAMIAREPRPSDMPWTPLRKPLSGCRVALISTAGVARNDDVPFDQQGERDDPFWGDPSFRVLPRGTTEQDVRLYHLHIATRFGEQELDCVLPLRRLQRGVLAAALAVLETAAQPGSVVHLPFEWPGDARRARIGPLEPPPIVRLILKKPWMFLRLLSGDLPPHGPAELSARETPPTFSRK